MPNVPPPKERTSAEGAYVVSCAVFPSEQKRGVMKELLRCFEKISKDNGLKYLRLHTRTADNPDNNNAYLAMVRLGFDITGILPNHLDQGDHFYEMVKRLKD